MIYIFSSTKIANKVCLLLAAIFLFGFAPCLSAAEGGGLLVDVSKSVAKRNDIGTTTTRHIGTMSVDRTMTLKVNVRNTAAKDMLETEIQYVVLIQRWRMSESAEVERIEGTAKLPAIMMSHDTSVNLGEFQISGHMHGTSDRHMDHLAAWKIIITRDGKKIEFTSGSNFTQLDDKAKKS